MHEITGATAINNHFVDGTSTQSGTVVTADFLNSVQDEICNAIKLSGIALNEYGKDDNKQLYTSIQKIVSNAVVNLVTKVDFDNLTKSLLDNYVAKDIYNSALQDLNARVDDNKKRLDEITKQYLN